ncbi:MAG: hypothetical protein SGI73_12870 [Chloroflexota bacterium]|nr:hypothetical protein [Chloroflexota bacterium]
MSEQKDKKYVKEWSFSFDKLSDQIGDFFKSVGVSAQDMQDAIQHGQFSAPLAGGTSARVRLDLSVGEATIKPLAAASTNLIEADLTYVGEIKFVTEGETERVVHLAQVAGASDWFRSFFSWVGSRRALRWDIALSPALPMDLEIHTGVGESDLDLSALNVTALRVSGGTGEIELTLPGASSAYAATINSGVGETTLTLPDNVTADLQVRMGTGESTLRFGENISATVEMSGGIGECTLIFPEGAAVRIEGKQGIGAVRVPARFARLGGADGAWNSSGVWQTVNYDAAERKIAVTYAGGIGELHVK